MPYRNSSESSLRYLSRAYQRISRSVRQTLALKTKLKRDVEQHAGWLAARELGRRALARREPALSPIDRAARRRSELETAVARVIWAEREFDGPDWEDRQEQRFERMETLLVFPGHEDRYACGTLDEDVIKLCADLGFSRVNALNWRQLHEPEFDDEDEEDDPEAPAEARRSSG